MQVSEQVAEIERLKEVIQLSEDGALMDQYIKAEREIERLRGCKFSDRNYAAMQSRLEEQAARIKELETLRGNSVPVPGPALDKMRKLLRWLGRVFGVATWYQVSATYRQDSHTGTSIVSLTCRVTPWLHNDNYNDLLRYVESQATRPASMPVITNISKLGV